MTDGATQYAEDVVAGRYVANKHIRNACERHLRDLERTDIRWEPHRVKDPLEFFERFCSVVDPQTQEMRPMRLFPWQQFLMTSLFGWVIGENDKRGRVEGTRRFRKVCVTSAKASGKTQLFSALHLYLMARDHYYDTDGKKRFINNPHTVVLASKLEQAIDLCMRDLADMVRAQPELREHAGFEVVGGEKPHKIICTSSGGQIAAIPAKRGGRGVRGLKLTGAHMEEVSEAGDRELWEAVVSGLKATPQPLLSVATNSPANLWGIAYDEIKLAMLAAEGTETYDDMLGLIYTLDDEYIPKTVVGLKQWAPPKKVWEQGNPSLRYGVPLKDYISAQVSNANTTYRKREVLRLNFGVLDDARTGYIEKDALVACEVEKVEPRDGARLWLGLDIALKDDLTALSFLWEHDGRYLLRVKTYTGLADLEERETECSGALTDWAEEGFLHGNDDSYLDLDLVTSEIGEAIQKYDVCGLVIDPHRRPDLEQSLQRVGVRYKFEKDKIKGDALNVVMHPQGFMKEAGTGMTMHTSMEALEGLVDDRQVDIERNPLLQWAIISALVKTSQDNIRCLSKKDTTLKNRGKIDALVSAVMCTGLMKRGDDWGEEVVYNPWSDPNYSLSNLQI